MPRKPTRRTKELVHAALHEYDLDCIDLATLAVRIADAEQFGVNAYVRQELLSRLDEGGSVGQPRNRVLPEALLPMIQEARLALAAVRDLDAGRKTQEEVARAIADQPGPIPLAVLHERIRTARAALDWSADAAAEQYRAVERLVAEKTEHET